MAYRINDLCNSCGICARGCKNGAIKSSAKGYCIDAAKCAKCGACADICPVGAAVKCD
ncbi:MAG: 4Fe-4S binding protein [Bacillota bacterium]